jgi:hypothetical protein
MRIWEQAKMEEKEAAKRKPNLMQTRPGKLLRIFKQG